MAKREYRKDADARNVIRAMRLSEAEAGKLATVADAVGMADSELTRRVVLAVLAKFESTGAIELGGETFTLQPALFGGMVAKTQSREAAQVA